MYGLPRTHDEWAKLKGITARTLRRWRNEDEPFKARMVLEKDLRAKQDKRPNSSLMRRSAIGGIPPSPRRRATIDAEAGEDPELIDPDVVAQRLIEEADGDEGYAVYLSIKQDLEAQAQEDLRAKELYLKTFGSIFVEAEKQQRDSDWSSLSDAQLVSEVLTLIGSNAVEAWLDAQSDNT